MKRTRNRSLFSIAAILFIAGFTLFASHKYNKQKAVYANDLLMANIEALSDNESEGTSTCEGLLGVCSFECSSCGYTYWSIGSKFTNRHKCKQ